MMKESVDEMLEETDAADADIRSCGLYLTETD